jgi:hypothetical protein
MSLTFHGDSARVLAAISERLDGSASIAELAGATGFSPSALAAVLAPLAEDGLLVDVLVALAATSAEEFLPVYKRICRSWATEMTQGPFWRTLLEGRASRELVLGWGIEFYHYVASANEHMAASVAHCRTDNLARQWLAQHYVEEHDHAAIFLDGLVACGFDADQRRRSPPLAKIIAALELPPGALNVIQGPGSPTGEALVGHRDVDAIAFTGGSATGRRIMELASRSLTRFVGELGGNAPTLVFADADLDRAIDGTILCAYANNGEVCVAGSRILVEQAIYGEFVDRFVARARAIRVGDPLEPDTELGPVISARHLERLQSIIASARASGATLRCGGERLPGPGHYLAPTVLTDLGPGVRLLQEEILGPVVTIRPFSERGRGRAAGQRHRVRPGRLRVDAQRRAHLPDGEPAAGGHGVGQHRADTRCPRAVRRLQAERSRPAGRPAQHRRVHPGEEHLHRRGALPPARARRDPREANARMIPDDRG